MNNKKSYTAPFWFLIAIICVQAYFLCVFIQLAIGQQELAEKYLYDVDHPMPALLGQLINQSIQLGITVLILIAESVVLWRIQKKRFTRFFAWAYIILLLFVLIFIPVWAISDAMLVTRILVRPNEALYWLFVGAAHIFFSVMLMQVYKRKKQSALVDPANLLDDYAEVD